MLNYIYLAFMNPIGKWHKKAICILMDYSIDNDIELRTWLNPQSGIIIFALKLIDIGEDTGSDICDLMKGLFEGLGLASKEEFYSAPIVSHKSSRYIVYSSYGTFYLKEISQGKN